MIPSVLNGPDISPASLGRDQPSGRHTHPGRSVDFDNAHLKSRSLPFRFRTSKSGQIIERPPRAGARRLHACTVIISAMATTVLPAAFLYNRLISLGSIITTYLGPFVPILWSTHCRRHLCKRRLCKLRLWIEVAVNCGDFGVSTPKRFSLAALFVKAHARTAKGRPGHLPICKRPARQK